MKIRHIVPLEKVAIIMSDNDNVAVAKKNIKKGSILKFKDYKIKIFNMIPQGHRFALTDIERGAMVRQYGYPFGVSIGIKVGQIVNKTNIIDYSVDYKKLEKGLEEKNKRANRILFQKGLTDRTFMGYKRKNSGVGTRNYYLLVPTSMCAADVATKIACDLDNDQTLFKNFKNIDGFVAAAHTEGCGCNDGEIIDRLLLTLKNTIIHPNVGAALIIDLGCEKTNREIIKKYLNDLSTYCKPIDFVSIQESGGTYGAISKGKKIVLSRVAIVNRIKREKISLKHLIVGTECGASDSFSGITANPLIGKVSDRIIESGGSVILSETPEMVGAESYLFERMVSKKVVLKFLKGMRYYKTLADKLKVSLEGNFVPGNEKGGLVNLTLKSLGAVLKGGSSKIVDFIDYAEHIKKPGLSIMNGPGNDLESMTGIVASGANIILFSTGMGATEGNLIVPVIKISSKTETYKKLNKDIDFNAGRLLDNDITFDEMVDELLNLVIEVASGKKTWAEIWKKRSFQIWTAGKLSL